MKSIIATIAPQSKLINSILSIIRLEYLNYIIRSIILPLPDMESSRKFPVLGILTSTVPVQDTGNTSIFDLDTDQAYASMREHDAVFVLEEHACQEAPGVRFW